MKKSDDTFLYAIMTALATTIIFILERDIIVFLAYLPISFLLVGFGLYYRYKEKRRAEQGLEAEFRSINSSTPFVLFVLLSIISIVSYIYWKKSSLEFGIEKHKSYYVPIFLAIVNLGQGICYKIKEVKDTRKDSKERAETTAHS